MAKTSIRMSNWINWYILLNIQINYIAEKHLGQITINNYSLKQNYLCSNDKLMTKEQFISTVNLGLEFISERKVEKD